LRTSSTTCSAAEARDDGVLSIVGKEDKPICEGEKTDLAALGRPCWTGWGSRGIDRSPRRGAEKKLAVPNSELLLAFGSLKNGKKTAEYIRKQLQGELIDPFTGEKNIKA